MGSLGLRVAEQSGGSGLGTEALCPLVAALGAGLVPAPTIPAAMAASVLPADHLAEVASGEPVIVPAWQEQPGRQALDDETLLRHGRLTGRTIVVPMAAGADAFLVTPPGGLALIERRAPGLRREVQPSRDGGHFGTPTFEGAPAEALAGDAGDAPEQMIIAHSQSRSTT